VRRSPPTATGVSSFRTTAAVAEIGPRTGFRSNG
jgi:hypothetical protein